MTKENGKPQIRFAKFKDTWEQRKVSEIAIEKLSNGIMNNQSDDETGVKHINVINMYDTDKIHPEKLTFSNYDEEAVKKCNVEFGDIFLTRSSLKPEGIAEANVLLDSGHFVYDDHLIRLKVNKEKYDPFFVKLNLSGNAFKRQFIVRAKTTAFTTIGQEDISECLGFFPKKEEQQQIGEYFMTLDHLITLHQRKYDKLTKVKKSMLEKMFPKNGANVPEIRFKGFTDAWEQRKLGEMMEVTSVKRIHQSDWTDSGVRFLRARDIVAESKKENVSEPLFISQEKYDEYSAVSGKVKKGDLLVTGVGTIGVPMLINSEEPLYFKDGNIIWFKNENVIDGRFFYYSFNGLNIQKFIKESAGLGTVGTYTIENGKKTPINLPPKKDEQAKIGEYFFNLDHLITLHQRELEKLKILKKACLEKMFV